MTGPGQVIAHVATARGDARLVGYGSLSRTFVFEAEGRVYRDEWDPRDSGATLLVAPSKWSEPSEDPIDPVTRETILDAFWKLSEETQAIAHIIEWRPVEKCRVAVRWNRGAGGFLARVGEDLVEYLELQQTAFVPHRVSSRGAQRVATLGSMSDAVWRYPAPRAVTPVEWERIHRNLTGMTGDDMFFTDAGWVVE